MLPKSVRNQILVFSFLIIFFFLIFRSALEAPPAPGRDLPRTPLKKTDDNAQDFKETGMYGIVNGGKILMISCLIFLSLKCYKIQLASIF